MTHPVPTIEVKLYDRIASFLSMLAQHGKELHADKAGKITLETVTLKPTQTERNP